MSSAEESLFSAPLSTYNLLHRHGWRKPAPDKRNSKTDVAARIEWKKFPETVAEVSRQWEGNGPLRLMFQDEARFGRISDTRRRSRENFRCDALHATELEIEKVRSIVAWPWIISALLN